jgi:hypothetical protein
MGNNNFTDDAVNRIGLAKKISEVTQQKTGHTDEEWHVFTFKEDKYNPDPHRFRVFTTRKSILPFSNAVVPVKPRFDIYIREDKESIVVMNKQVKNMNSLKGEMPLPPLIGQETYKHLDIKDWIIRFE